MRNELYDELYDRIFYLVDRSGLEYFIDVNSDGSIVINPDKPEGSEDTLINFGDYDDWLLEFFDDEAIDSINSYDKDFDGDDLSEEEEERILNATDKKEELEKIWIEKVLKEANVDKKDAFLHNPIKEKMFEDLTGEELKKDDLNLNSYLTYDVLVSILIDSWNKYREVKINDDEYKYNFITEDLEKLKEKYNSPEEIKIIDENIEKIENTRLIPKPNTKEEILHKYFGHFKNELYSPITYRDFVLKSGMYIEDDELEAYEEEIIKDIMYEYKEKLEQMKDQLEQDPQGNTPIGGHRHP